MSQQTVIVDGRAYPLFKRSDSPNAAYCTRIQVNMVRRSVALGTSDLEQAKAKAVVFVRAALEGNWEKVSKMRPEASRRPVKWSTFGAVQKHLPPIAAAPAYFKAAMTLLTEAGGFTEAQFLGLTIDHLTPAIARKFQALRQHLKKPDPAKPTPHNGTANSIFGDARMLFSRKACAHYEKAGLHIPDLSDFHAVPYLIEEKDRYSDHPITDATLRKIDALLPTCSEAVQQAHWSIRLHGKAPGTIETNPAHTHALLLKKFGHTPSDLWHHAAACMLRRTGSFAATAEWCGMSVEQTKWHTEAFLVPLPPLSHAETLLGVTA